MLKTEYLYINQNIKDMKFELIPYTVVSNSNLIIKTEYQYHCYQNIKDLKMELIPYSVLSNLINQLDSSFFDYFGEIYGVKFEIDCIRCYADTIRTLCRTEFDDIMDASKVIEEGQKAQEWITNLKCVLLPVDDYFERIAATATQYSKVRNFFSLSSNPLQISRQIKRILKDFQALLDSFRSLQKNGGGPFLSPECAIFHRIKIDSSIQNERRDLVSAWLSDAAALPNFISSVPHIIIGRQCEKVKIVNMLLENNVESDHVSSIAIVGLAGIGKKTLAQMVYNDDQVKEFFDKRVWVRVSNRDVSPNVNTLVYKILKDLAAEPFQEHHHLCPTRNLVVLECMPTTTVENWWNQFTSCYLTCGAAQGSTKILLTCSDGNPSEQMNVFDLNELSDKESLSLLMMLALPDTDRYDKDENGYPILEMLEPISKAIASHCHGVPLAIRTVATILHGKHKVSDWFSVYKNMWNLNENLGRIMSYFKLTYQDMPLPLKQCVAYCSLYPKNWEIEKNELILLWMAQGYLESLNGVQQMEDVGNEYVTTLLKKSVFQDVKFDEHGYLLSFKMHEFMHDLAFMVARDDFYLDSEKKVNTPLHLRFSSESLNSLDASRLRTFYLSSERGTENRQIARKLSIILNFKSLRVLKLSHSSLKKLPDLIGRLQHLRYLDLSWCVRLASLPKSICNLVNLQTLKLTGCERLKFCPEIVITLVNLRHLEIQRCKAFVDKMPTGLGKLSLLQSLSTFNVVADDDDDMKKKKNKATGKLNELRNLNNLRGNLEINGLEQVKDVKLESYDVNLADKKFLESLDLNWGNLRKTTDSNHLQLLENLRPHEHLRRLNVKGYPGEKFSNWISSIKHVSHISLFGFDNCKYLPPLEELPYLKSLSICSMRVLEYILVSPTAETFFPSLERLNISSCNKLRGWNLTEHDVSTHLLSLHQFRRLSQLMINECPNLTSLPARLHQHNTKTANIIG